MFIKKSKKLNAEFIEIKISEKLKNINLLQSRSVSNCQHIFLFFPTLEHLYFLLVWSDALWPVGLS